MKWILHIAAFISFTFMVPALSEELTLSYCLSSPNLRCQELATRECDNKNGDACWLSGYLLPLNDLKNKAKYARLGCSYGSPQSCRWLAGFLSNADREKFLYKACNLSTQKTKNGAEYCEDYADFLEDFSDNYGGVSWALSKACKLGDSDSCRKIRVIKKDRETAIFLQEKAFLFKKFFDN